MVSKRYFEQRSLDGLQMKAQAYSCKIGQAYCRLETSGLFNFLKYAAIFRICIYEMRMSRARAG